MLVCDHNGYAIERTPMKPALLSLEPRTTVLRLTKGRTSLIDTEEYEQPLTYFWSDGASGVFRLCDRKWSLSQDKYAGTHVLLGGKQRTIYVHRLICQTPAGMHTDHIDCNGLNNRRSNLRICTQRQNNINRRSSRESLASRGVIQIGPGRWRARIVVNRRGIHLGVFDDQAAAVRAYDVAAQELFGVFARPNDTSTGSSQ